MRKWDKSRCYLSLSPVEEETAQTVCIQCTTLPRLLCTLVVASAKAFYAIYLHGADRNATVVDRAFERRARRGFRGSFRSSARAFFHGGLLFFQTNVFARPLISFGIAHVSVNEVTSTKLAMPTREGDTYRWWTHPPLVYIA